MTVRWLLAVTALVAGCSAPLGTPDGPTVAGPTRPAVAATAGPVPAGDVTVAVPHPVGTWWQADVEDLGAGDLAPLWTLPLFHTDELGRRVPALAADVQVLDEGPGWIVAVDLAPGTWSDGRPVTAADVVATAEALAAVRPAAWGAWSDATAVDDDTVHLRFDRPFAAWAGLLSAPPGILPAHVLADGGLAAYADGLPVTGGWFTLEGSRPGRSASFAAHPGSPLGPPGLSSVEALVVPSHDTALGLLADGSADAVMGHVVLDPAARREGVDGVVGAAVLGGTRFELVWPAGRGTAAVRAAAAGRLDPTPFVDGLLRDVGRAPGGLTPALPRMDRPGPAPADVDVTVQLTRVEEGLGLLARRLQADLADAGVTASLVRLDPPDHLASPIAADAHLRVVRVPPDRSLAALLDEVGLDTADALAADAAGHAPVDPLGRVADVPPAVLPVVEALVADPRVLPVAEVAVTHVWSETRLRGVQPSAWPGIGLWNVGRWTVP